VLIFNKIGLEKRIRDRKKMLPLKVEECIEVGRLVTSVGRVTNILRSGEKRIRLNFRSKTPPVR